VPDALPHRLDPGKPVLVGEALGLAEKADCRVDQAHMGKGLGEVADEPCCDRVVLLGQETEIVPERQQPLEQLLRLLLAAGVGVVVGELEAAGEECALAAGQAVYLRLAGGELVAAFASVGWAWGGRWTSSPDYQHFSATGG